MKTSLRWLGRGALVVLVLIGTLAFVGWRWERAEHRAFQEASLEGPGRMLAAGDRLLHVVAEGSGPQGVLFISGLGDDLRGWSELASRLSDSVRVVSYDRPGLGWSPRGREEPGLVQAVEDAAALLANPDLFDAPPIVVGHSYGGVIARQLAFENPELISGLILVDPTPPDPLPPVVNVITSLGYRAMASLAAVGYTRWRFYRANPEMSREAQLRWGNLYASGARARQVLREIQVGIKAARAPLSPGELGDLPLTVMLANAPSIPGMARALAELDASRHRMPEESLRGRLVKVDTSHYVHWDDVEVVLREISRMLQEAR